MALSLCDDPQPATGIPTCNFWHALTQPIIGLSPMDGVTDAAFRWIVAMQTPADVSFTEFTSVGDICRGPDFMLSSLLYSECERPVVAQLYGKDPALFYQAAHVVCELGFDGIDINMGCPSKNVASSGSGAGLIRTPDVAQAILRATRQGMRDWAHGHTLVSAGIRQAKIDTVGHMIQSRSGMAATARRSIPLSVKTRLGYDSVIVERWISHLAEERPAVISIHGRTLEQMYRGEADWQAIARAARVVQGTGILVLGNGDVQSMSDVVSRLLQSEVHGVLIGRGALGAPWFFRSKVAARRAIQENRHCTTAMADSEGLDTSPDLSTRFRVLLEHARQFETFFGVQRFPRMRKHLGWYCKGFRHAAALRTLMVRASSSDDVERFVSEHQQRPADSSEHPATMDSSPRPVPLSCV